jgi:RNase adapter protein RapZ
MTTQLSKLVLVTGMTGAGKGSAAKGLEKLGYYVIDNLPADVLVETVETVERSGVTEQMAVVVDARSGPFFDRLVDVLEELRDRGTATQILFLEAADEVLVRRQEAARRPHPLSREGRLMDGFRRERELLSRLRGRADIVIDTTNLNVHQLGQRIQAAFEDADSKGLRASVVSFGFKYGIPIDADMVADMRFLPNPHWVDELRPLTGLDEPVRDYVRKQPRYEEFLDSYEGLVALLTDGFLHEDKHFLTIAIGCTGGRHRSVAMAEAFAERLRSHGVRTLVVHRDLGRE